MKVDRGTTSDTAMGHTREPMRGTESKVVPTPPEGVQTAPDQCGELSNERKEELRRASARKMQMMEQEYWRFRNGKQLYMKCPYCKGLNFEGDTMCCALFIKALRAIFKRQEEVDEAAQHIRNLNGVGLVN